ncbi:FadR/GntR family transcriptional regulator [Paracoccus benzoatiresistens]|uniref:FCD domain-containing protein n=1 Tax=Paracoccus benzoatiresistens TaxID=2997341 RepID=A0ABT4J7P8_9RHOB|nr:FCD domain-containing protein [Paracoccus sp. EF6]MCZ0963156.1 FCD domain-containing protein [Paracoccus sp. EF6]
MRHEALTDKKRRLDRIKLSDQIAEDIRRRIARDAMRPGDRLPHERALMEHYGCSKGTMREALKALEVEGLVRMLSGPNGGPEIQHASIDIATQQLRQFLHFQKLDFAHVYELRKSLEESLARNVTGRLTPDHLRRLEDNIRVCEAANNDQDRILVRQAETEFHDILCEASDNVLLVFMCRFLNSMLRDLVSYRSQSMREHENFGEANIESHKELLSAFRAGDAERAARAMHQHMCCAESYMRRLDASFRSDLLSRF